GSAARSGGEGGGRGRSFSGPLWSPGSRAWTKKSPPPPRGPPPEGGGWGRNCPPACGMIRGTGVVGFLLVVPVVTAMVWAGRLRRLVARMVCRCPLAKLGHRRYRLRVRFVFANANVAQR